VVCAGDDQHGTIYAYTDSTCTEIQDSTVVNPTSCHRLGGTQSYRHFCMSELVTPTPTPSITPRGSYVRTTTYTEPGCTGTLLETNVVFGTYAFKLL
jgi:hypothetical protein